MRIRWHFYAALFLSLASVLFAMLFPFYAGAENLAMKLALDLAPPSQDAILGRAENGIDLLTLLAFGARRSLGIAFITTLISFLLGTFYGIFSAQCSTKVDNFFMRIVDVFLAFPGILLAIYLSAILTPSSLSTIIALSAFGWTSFARLSRAQTLDLQQMDFIRAAHINGASRLRISAKHLLPNMMPLLLNKCIASFAINIIAEASLSFLGLGLLPGTPSLGALLEQGTYYLFLAPHIALVTSAYFFLLLLGLNLLVDTQDPSIS